MSGPALGAGARQAPQPYRQQRRAGVDRHRVHGADSGSGQGALAGAAECGEEVWEGGGDCGYSGVFGERGGELDERGYGGSEWGDGLHVKGLQTLGGGKDGGEKYRVRSWDVAVNDLNINR